MSLSTLERSLISASAGRLGSIPPAGWAGLFNLARRHEVAEIVASQVRSQVNKADIPAAVVDEAQEIVASAVIRQGLETREIGNVLQTLDGSPSFLFKGASIARRWYPVGGRSDRDIDIHVPFETYQHARKCLEHMGYRIIPSESERLQLLQGKDVGFVRLDDAGHTWFVELHLRLTEPGAPSLDSGSIWDKLVELPIADASIPVPGPEHTLILLALNLRKHRFARLKTIVDIGRLIQTEQIDWSFIEAEVRKAGFRGLMIHTLSLASEMLGLRFESETSHWIAEARPRGITMRLLPRVATADTVMGEQRGTDASKTVSGLIPFVSLDKTWSALHLVYKRLAFEPEMANYFRRQGDPDTEVVYRSRRQYWRDTVLRVVRAGRMIVRTTTSKRHQGANNSWAQSNVANDNSRQY